MAFDGWHERRGPAAKPVPDKPGPKTGEKKRQREEAAAAGDPEPETAYTLFCKEREAEILEESPTMPKNER